MTGSAWGTLPAPWAPASATEPTTAHLLLHQAGGANRRDLVSNVIAFSRVLRTKVPNVTAGRIIDACRSLTFIDVEIGRAHV